MNNNGESAHSDSQKDHSEEVKTPNYPAATKSVEKDFESPYSIYMTQPTGAQNQYGSGVGAGSYGSQNYGFNAPHEQYPAQQYPSQQAYQQQYAPQGIFNSNPNSNILKISKLF